jgi:hypothetical protein
MGSTQQVNVITDERKAWDKLFEYMAKRFNMTESGSIHIDSDIAFLELSEKFDLKEKI